MRFLCSTCGRWHEELPDIGFDAPYYWYTIPEAEREQRSVLTPDWCSIDDQDFFVRGVLFVPILGTGEGFGWGLWTSVSRQNFERYVETFQSDNQSSLGNIFGWMSSQIQTYPDMLRLKVSVRPQDGRSRPLLNLEPTDHPLAVEQLQGITMERVNQIVAPYLHPESDG